MSFRATVELSEQQVADLLCSAWEGGSNYWANAIGQPYSLTGALDFSEPIIVIDLANDGKRHRLTLAKVEAGCRLLGRVEPRILSDIVTERADAMTGDAFLQLCLFGEVLYS